MKNSKKLLSVLLTMIMTFSLMFGGLTTAFAAVAPVPNEPVAATAVNAGDTLADSTLSGTFKVSDTDPTLVAGALAWDAPATVVNATGNFAWTFTPTDTTTYTVVTGTVSVTATYTATFDSQGGSTVASITGIASGATVTLPTDPTKAGNTFASWNTAADGTGTEFDATTAVAVNVTVYAQWVAKTVTVGSQAGTILAATATQSATFTVTTASIADGQAVTIEWFAAGGTTPAADPTGVTATGSNVAANTSTITVSADATSVAGNYYFKATIDGISSGLVTVTVATPVQLTIADPTLTLTKVADGNTTAAVTVGALTGVVVGDDVTVSAVANYDTADVGTGKTITVVYTLGGADAAKYVTPVNYTVATGEITATPVTPAAPSVTRDDTANTVTGMAIGMEYKLDAAGYVIYDAKVFGLLDFSGAHTLLARVAAEGINPFGLDTTLTFTTNPVTYASTDAPANATVSVTNGTVEADAIAALDQTVGVVGTSSETGIATIAWTMASYSATVAGDYIATGVLTLPTGWTGTPVDVTATITVTVAPDTTAPYAPVVTNTGYINSTNQTDYAITGTGEAGEIVDVYVYGNAWLFITTSAVVDVDGKFSVLVNVSSLSEGSISITAFQTDAAGNVSPWSAPVSVTKDTTSPVITLNGDSIVTVAQGSTYTDAGAMATDNVDGDISGTVDTNTLGSYTITYNVSDAAGNLATEVTRTVIVAAPVGDITGNNILLIGDYAFDLSDPANNDYNSNNFLVAANTAYLNAGTYEVYFRIGDAWYDIVSDPTMITPISDLLINGDGLFKYMNMQ